MESKKKITILSACYNEQENIRPLYETVKNIMAGFPQFEYEQIFADNCSTDRSAEIMEEIAAQDKNIKVVLNLRNYGLNRSGLNILRLASGDAVISMASDFQDPPEMIAKFVEKWAEGNKIVWGQRTNNNGKRGLGWLRKLYYKLIQMISESEEYAGCTGFGIYDKEVVDWIRWMDDPEPYVRNEVTALGYRPVLIPFEQQKRRAGKSSYNFMRYFDEAVISMVASSRKPLRFVTYLGLFSAIISIVVAAIYLILKLINWYNFNAGMAPLVIGLFFLGAVQLICLGVVGEYVGAILLRVKKRPIVIARKMINFDSDQHK